MPVLVLSALLTGAFAVAALGLEFEDSVRSMRPEGSPAVEFREEVARRFGSGFGHMMLLIRSDSAEEVLHLADIAAARAAELVEQGVLTGVDSVASVLPSPARQDEVLAVLRQARGDGFDPQERRERFVEALDRAGLRAPPFAAGLDLFEEAVSIDRRIEIAELEAEPQSRRLLDRYLRRAGDEWQTVVYLYPPPKVWRREAPPQVDRACRGARPAGDADGQ